MSDYKGINISPEITIVERIPYRDIKGTPQGYIVPSNRPNIMESALRWANNYNYNIKGNGAKLVVKDPNKVHTYKNGTFKLKLYESAQTSSQGGRLSFWNCTVVAEDGREFVIGINQALLLNILMNSTVINGEVQGNVWLGREKTNTGVYLESMETFKQAVKDEETRNLKLTTAYQIGDVVTTRTGREERVYVGTAYKYFSIDENDDNRHKTLTIFKEPKIVHAYRSLERGWRDLHRYWFEDSKLKRLIKSHVSEDFTSSSLYEDMQKEKAFIDDVSTYERWNLWSRFYEYVNWLQYSFSNELKPGQIVEMILARWQEDNPCRYIGEVYEVKHER